MINGQIFRDAVISAAYNITNQRDAVNALNVFPVPDGDTGTNMSMTITSARKELERLPDDVAVDKVAKTTSSAMLRGARGNSGVILSLIFRGLAKGLKGKEEIDVRDMILALSYGVESAYKAVMTPTEGTILTVVRLATQAGARYGTEHKEASFAEVFAHVIEGARDALAQTPELLPVLKKAGVVDAGGQGLLLIFEGMQSVFQDGVIVANTSDSEPQEQENVQRREAAPAPAPAEGAESASVPAAAGEPLTSGTLQYIYCVELLVMRDPAAKKDPTALKAYLESIGDQLTVKVEPELIKVHVHTNDPGRAMNQALKYGVLAKAAVNNMDRPENDPMQKVDLHQYHSEPERIGEPDEESSGTVAPVEITKEVGFVSVSAGDGIAALFQDIGVDLVVSGGQTMNPSTEDILNAVEQVPASTVFVLPNNKNIIMAAEQVAALSTRKVIVLPTRTIPQGVTALIHYNPDLSVEENHLEMSRSLDTVDTAQVTFAARDSVVDGLKIKEGQMLGMENGAITVVEDSALTAAYKITRHLCNRKTTMVTIFFGEGATEEEATELESMIRDKFKDIETAVIPGGQPVYSYIISVE
ncbi:MAG: DAK2 domain-containing protein [Clostridiales bacterium]|nr:DAK2 domain-containing protein [Clostridia bacterium]MBQ1529544.1 DAK2 domain-containing protein [Clostridia bacterium]MBQ5580753.1 DAK2 domain-containing protein [Clostridia bacterium]MBR1826861.1 DAK2 domain-containing protein [Clostridia bacterium]NLD30193.1 DAK2 domain-containing protein [Clostridiales bacterium]